MWLNKPYWSHITGQPPDKAYFSGQQRSDFIWLVVSMWLIEYITQKKTSSIPPGHIIKCCVMVVEKDDRMTSPQIVDIMEHFLVYDLF